MDYGIKRLGIAVSDPLGITAQPLMIIERKNIKEDFQKIKKILDDNNIKKIIVGLPLNMDGSEGYLMKEVNGFAQKMKDEFNIPVELFDERLSSLQTERILVEEADMSREKRKGVRDKIAAALFLQAYLDSHR